MSYQFTKYMQKKSAEITILKKNIKEIIFMYEAQKQLNNTLKNDNEKLKNKIKIIENNISELKQKYKSLKFAKTLTASDAHTNFAKIKINKLVKEIDKCIGLLNKLN